MQVFKTRAELEAALQVGTVGEHIIEDEPQLVIHSSSYYLGDGDLTEEFGKEVAEITTLSDAPAAKRGFFVGLLGALGL